MAADRKAGYLGADATGEREARRFVTLSLAGEGSVSVSPIHGCEMLQTPGGTRPFVIRGGLE